MSNQVLQSSRTPLYLQVAEILRQRINRGVWKKDEILPTFDSLMAEFGVAKVTVRQAIKLLEAEGLVLPKRGRGTIVTAVPSGRRPLKVELSMKDILEVYRGDVPNLEHLEDGVQMPDFDAPDGKLGDSYYHLKRIHARDGVRYCVISIFMEETVFRAAEEEYRTRLVLPVLFSRPDLNIVRARQTMIISKCDMETAALIGIGIGDPVAEVRRVLYDENDVAIYLADVIYRGDYIHLDMDLRP